ncbi:MAG: galactokinase, partial [Bacteroidales bacterium]
MKIEDLKARFLDLYDKSNENLNLYFAPGRVNLIGEHTDYNGGYVFPCALSFGTYLLARRNHTRTVKFSTVNFDSSGEISLDGAFEKDGNSWINYPLGVINELRKLSMEIEGLDLLYSGDIPNSAGLSSSASIEMVTGTALNDLYGFNIEKMELVKIGQKAENNFVGVNCGIMDQFACGMGAKDHALFLNCETLDYQKVPLVMDGIRIVISNTNLRRGLAESKYNERRSECDTAVAEISKVKPIANLSKLSLEEFKTLSENITSEVVKRRAHHVISENDRTLRAITALNNHDIAEFGKLMNESHDSLRDDYEVTGIELDTLVEEARKIPGTIGSRMTGAGFGGCTVSLVRQDAIEEFTDTVGRNYKERTG